MSVTTAKVLLDKINTLYRSMSLDTNHINAIERDLMLSYIRQLYESFLMNEVAPVKQVEKTVVKEEVPKVEKQIEIPVVKPVESVTKPVVPPPAREDKSLVVEFMPKASPKQTPTTTPPPVTTPPVAEPVQAELPEPPAPQPAPVQPEVPKTSPVPPVTFSPASFSGSDDPKITSLFVNEKASDLSAKLGESSIPDIRKSMGINDRLLVIKELFGGDNHVFDEAVGTLNNLSGFEEAQQYIISHLVQRFRWTTDDKKGAARDFIKLVRRRYK